MSCEVRNYDSTGGDWISATSTEGVSACNLSDGFEITLAEYANFLPSTYVEYRIKYEAPDSLLSEEEGAIIYDYFEVRYHHECADLTVAIDELADVTYYVISTNTDSDTNEDVDSSYPTLLGYRDQLSINP